jgi:hypothetical protein
MTVFCGLRIGNGKVEGWTRCADGHGETASGVWRKVWRSGRAVAAGDRLRWSPAFDARDGTVVKLPETKN